MYANDWSLNPFASKPTIPKADVIHGNISTYNAFSSVQFGIFSFVACAFSSVQFGIVSFVACASVIPNSVNDDNLLNTIQF